MQLCQQRSIWDIFYKKEYYDVKSNPEMDVCSEND